MNPFQKLTWVFYYSNRKITNTSLKAVFLSIHLEEKYRQKNINFTKKLGSILIFLFDLLLYVLSKYILITSSTFFPPKYFFGNCKIRWDIRESCELKILEINLQVSGKCREFLK